MLLSICTVLFKDFGHSHWHNSVMWAELMDNITIMGGGSMNGGGISSGTASPGPPS
jgi:predicted transcriptional regulator